MSRLKSGACVHMHARSPATPHVTYRTPLLHTCALLCCLTVEDYVQQTWTCRVGFRCLLPPVHSSVNTGHCSSSSVHSLRHPFKLATAPALDTAPWQQRDQASSRCRDNIDATARHVHAPAAVRLGAHCLHKARRTHTAATQCLITARSGVITACGVHSDELWCRSCVSSSVHAFIGSVQQTDVTAPIQAHHFGVVGL